MLMFVCVLFVSHHMKASSVLCDSWKTQNRTVLIIIQLSFFFSLLHVCSLPSWNVTCRNTSSVYANERKHLLDVWSYLLCLPLCNSHGHRFRVFRYLSRSSCSCSKFGTVVQWTPVDELISYLFHLVNVIGSLTVFNALCSRSQLLDCTC